jgi:hypothetical protein
MLKQINTFVVLFDFVALDCMFIWCYLLSYSYTESYVCSLREVQTSENLLRQVSSSPCPTKELSLVAFLVEDACVGVL